jgi:DNA/RNA endonuclease YhcR with UshA esterase domain
VAQSLRFMVSAALCLVAWVTPAAAQAQQKKFAASEAKDHYGEMATVCGEVVSARYAATSNGGPTFLNFDKAYPNQIFTAVIWGDNRSKFGRPEDDLQGKRICVSGKITAYAGLPEIVLEDPKQLSMDARKIETAVAGRETATTYF